jgi:hypothetical protein
MATTVATAPNDSSDDLSGTEIDDREEQHQEEEIAEDSESEASVMDAVGSNEIGKIAELQKKETQIIAQCTRVLKQRDDNVRKHAQVLRNKKNVINGTKKLH